MAETPVAGWLVVLGALVLLIVVVAGVVVAFALDRRLGFAALMAVAMFLELGAAGLAFSQMGPGTQLFGGVMAVLIVPAGIVLVAVLAIIFQPPAAGRRRTDPAGRGRPTPPPVPRPAGPHRCPECGTALPADSPEGLCPRCLLGSGLVSPSPTPPTGGTTPYPGAFTAPTPAELAPHFPQLEILELIGQGGMGAVYKARQTKLDRLVAVKILPPEWGRDPAFAERFGREARALARLNHPHIVAVHDFGETAGLYYLVMEFVDGVNLRQALQAGPLPPAQALAVVPQICDALQYAHEEGIVHRDIKPENILLDRRGRVKIADFGLAKLLNRSRAEFTLTGSRQVMGTLDYMAPEQRQSPLEIDHRADIYSLGVVFYEMLTGELPLGRFAPPSQRAAVDVRLDEVVFRALETDPGRRYQSVGAVKTDVEAIAAGQPPAPRAVPPAQDGGPGADLVLALHQVRGPATGLLLAGLLTLLFWALVVLAIFIDPLWPTTIGFVGKIPSDRIAFQILLLLSVVPGVILIAGALKMRRCEAYELAKIASVTALFPLTGPVYVLCVLMGVWALLVLRKRRVRAGFVRQLQSVTGRGGRGPGLPAGPPRRPTSPPPRPTGPVRRKVRSFVESVLAMFVTRPGKDYPAEEDPVPERS